jgi:hypothetical protein
MFDSLALYSSQESKAFLKSQDFAAIDGKIELFITPNSIQKYAFYLLIILLLSSII